MDAAGCFYQSWGSATTDNERTVVRCGAPCCLFWTVSTSSAVDDVTARAREERAGTLDAVGIRDEQSEAPTQEVLHHVYRVLGSWPRRLAYV